MKNNKIFKIALLNIGIAVVNIIIFSPGLIGIRIGGASTLATAFGLTMIVLSAMIFLFGNYKLFFEEYEPAAVDLKKIETVEDYISVLKINKYKQTFSNKIDIILEQIERLQDKIKTINNILLQKFSSTEMSYTKFKKVIGDVENLFYINVRSILNKINAFDEKDYMRLRNQTAKVKLSPEVFNEKMSIYNEYIEFVQNSIEDNEHILLKLDKLLLEISKYNSLEDGEIENMPAMQEIDDLIYKTKLYKH